MGSLIEGLILRQPGSVQVTVLYVLEPVTLVHQVGDQHPSDERPDHRRFISAQLQGCRRQPPEACWRSFSQVMRFSRWVPGSAATWAAVWSL